MSKDHMNYLRRKTADESELWAADRIEQLEAECDELLAALNFARQGYQSRFENWDAGDVEWAKMYIESIDAAIAKGEIND